LDLLGNRQSAIDNLLGGFMNNFKARLTALLVLFVLAASGLLVLRDNLDQVEAQTVKTATKNTTTWEWSDDGWRRRVEIQGKAEFTEDYSDISGLSEGGFMRLEENLNGQSHRLEVRRDESGQLVRKYFVNGESRTLDENGRKWVAALLLTAVKHGAIDPEGRVKTLLRKVGVKGVLEEIAGIKGDHAKRIYFQALLKNESLKRGDLQSVLEATRTQIRSGHEKANLLRQSADLFLGDATLSEPYFQAISTIDSDYEQRQTLSALLQKNTLNEAALAQMLASLDTISSDYEKANLLKQGANSFVSHSSLSNPFFKAISTITSDYEHRQILSALLKNENLSAAVLAQMLDSLATISSDHEKATFLLEASRLYTGDARLRNAFLKATDTIKSEHERGRVLSALLRNKQIG
jgi:hypothetical protein